MVDATKDDDKPEATLQNEHDDIERSLGISEYFSPSSVAGFSAVVKARYSDFLVHEIDMDGSVARLTSLEVPKTEAPPPSGTAAEEAATAAKPLEEAPAKATPPNPETATKEATNTAAGTNGDKMDVETKKGSTKEEEAEPKSSLSKELSQLASLINDADIAKKVMILLESHNNNNNNSKTTESDKANSQPASAADETSGKTKLEKFVTLPALEKQQRKAVHEWVRNSLKCARADTLDGKIRIWHASFETEMPNYKAFGTHKKRKASHRAIQKKARSNWPPSRPDFLRFVLYKENCDTTTATRDVGRKGSTSRIGYAGMKDKRGITSQFCTMYRTLPEQIARGGNQRGSAGGGGNTKQKGYSIVHIGNFEYVSRELRLGQLKGNRFDVILRNVRLLETNSAASGDATGQRKLVLEAAAQTMKKRGFINYFGTQRFGKFHNTHLVGIAVLKGDFEKAVDILMAPNNEDRPDITKARKDWQDRFTYGKTKENESSTAKRVVKRLNRFMTAEIAIMQCLGRNPFDYKRAFGCIPKNLRMMFIHAVQSLIWNRATSHRIAKMDRDKVLVGDLVPKEANGGGGERVHIVTEDDVGKQKYTLEDILVPVVGSKTVFPTNELGAVLKDLLSDLGLTVELFKQCQDREIRANGDYRKAIIHPNDFDYSIKEYYHPLQPLLQTDLMKIHSEDIAIEPPPEKKEGEESSEKSPLVAMVVGFTLPSSSYATIALRELMKSPTSNEFQSRLKLE